jgi:hypothetical protein
MRAITGSLLRGGVCGDEPDQPPGKRIYSRRWKTSRWLIISENLVDDRRLARAAKQEKKDRSMF